jgi:hypothetical protein
MEEEVKLGDHLVTKMLKEAKVEWRKYQLTNLTYFG